MYYFNLPVTEALLQPAASFIHNIDLGVVTLAADIARPIPVNTTILASPDILIGDGLGSFFLLKPQVGFYSRGHGAFNRIQDIKLQELHSKM